MAKPIRFYGKDTQFFLSNGTVASGYYLYQYQSGTTTHADTYTDSGAGTANDNPLILNSAGRPAQDIYISQAMKFVLATSTDTDPPASPIWTIDTISAVDQLWQTLAKSTDYTTVAADNYKLITIDASGAARTVTLMAAATAGVGYIQAVKKIDSSTNTVTLDANASEKIDTDNLTFVLRNQHDTILYVSDGTGWQIISLFFGEAIVDGASVFTFSKGITMTDGDLTLSSGDISLTNEDSRTATVDYPVTITSTTSGTPAAGIGTGILIRAESADEAPSEFGAIEFCATDVTAASEDTYFDILTRVAGAALTKVWRFIATGAFKGIVTHANTADRTYTFPDEDMDLSDGIATQAEQETGTSVKAIVTPGRQHYNPKHPKAWGYVTVSGAVYSLTEGSGITSITDGATGIFAANWTTAFSTATYATPATVVDSSATGFMVQTGPSTTTGRDFLVNNDSGTDSDKNVHLIACGDQ